mmetsp:Transcript_22241/g.50931  ORF Transcript_22241/g.50931 Transcript_22241/m.50931 type:complete len:184 (+) Transcript_22241:144-695(+)
MSTTSVQVVTLSLMSFAAVGVHSSIAFSLSVPQLTGRSFVSRETYLAGNHDIKSSCGIREKRRKSRDRVRLTASLSSAPSLPRDVKDAVTKCRTAVQTALGDRLSRMDIEMPVGVSSLFCRFSYSSLINMPSFRKVFAHFVTSYKKGKIRCRKEWEKQKESVAGWIGFIYGDGSVKRHARYVR